MGAAAKRRDRSKFSHLSNQKRREYLKAWRAEKAREMLFLRRLFTRQHRRASCADLSLTHRLFLLRDDALFLRCLEYCWFLDPWKRYPSETDYRRAFGAADTEPES